jgi:DNA-binding winged helix-turn-helix (wHTH) protein
MVSPVPLSGVIRFDVFELDLRAAELYKAGRKIKLQIQPFRALTLLLERPGEVITREEFEKRLWPEDTFVDFDHSLNTAIKKLRQALGDDKKKPRFVETLPKRGYRFIGDLDRAASPVPSETRAASEPPVAPCVGRLATISGDGKHSFTLLSIDEEAAAEREKLDAANDDVGLSLLIASGRLLMVPCGTQVRILELREPGSRCQVRILESEHYGKTALVALEHLTQLP